MMRTLKLTEYQTETAFRLTNEERDTLRELVSSVIIQPTVGLSDCYDITPSSTIGAIETDSLSVEIHPKLPMERVLFLVSYALDPKQWRNSGFGFDAADSLVDAVVPGFARQVGRAIERGLLQGYRREEDSSSTVRGQIRFGDQIRDRFGLAPPVEVTFDEFTDDIIENQLLKAAIARLKYRRIRSEPIRRMLSKFDTNLATVSPVRFDPRALPEIQFTRLNEHYRPAIELATLILKSTSWDLRRGDFRASSFLVDMNQVFEEFVITALREELRVGQREFPSNCSHRTLCMDTAKRIRLKPDISWWDGNQCVFVGDVKYKPINVPGIKHADLYQLLAYTTATNLPSGLLIYAAGETEPRTHKVRFADKLLEVTALDLSGSPERILDQIRELAIQIRTAARSVHKRAIHA